ncbi:MAG: hypothetical protein ACREIT_03175 [Tepidisphaeraceae bacterium]
MANLFKRTVVRPVPVGASIEERRGKRFAVWTNGKGRPQRKPVVTTAKGERVCMGELRCWYGKIQLAGGRWRQVKLFTDKQASRARLDQLQTAHEQGAAGVMTGSAVGGGG